MEFIDFRLRWDGTLNRAALMDFFRISAQQASADIAVYTKLAPKNLEYDRNQKVYRASRHYRPAVVQDNAQTYLDQLASLATGALAASASFMGWRPPHDIVRYPTRTISAGTLLRVIWAIRDGDELKVAYQSMRRPALTSRWIAPHALAFDGLRWHVRSWCYEDCEFRDFVISRIQSVEAARQASVTGDADSWWHTYVDIVVVPRPGLTPGQQAAIESDFGMTRGRLKLKCRKALAFYLLRQLHLDRASDQWPFAQPLELANREALAEVIATGQKSVRPIDRHRREAVENHHD